MLQRNIQKHPDVCATFLENELVVMGVRDKIYYKINASGIHIWNFLAAKTCSVQAVIEFIANHYKVEPNKIAADVESFVLKMIEKNIFQYV